MARLKLDLNTDPTVSARKLVLTYLGADDRELQFTAYTDGVLKDLTSLTVTMSCDYGGTVVFADASCTVDVAADGTFHYTPASDDFDEAGDHDAQVKLADGSGNIDYLEPFKIRVARRIGA